MSWAELVRAGRPVFYLLLALSAYTLYLLLYASFLLRREGQVEEDLLDRLGDLAQLAPLLGLFGTTLGIIQAFMALSDKPNGILLAKGIAEALVNWSTRAWGFWSPWWLMRGGPFSRGGSRGNDS